MTDVRGIGPQDGGGPRDVRPSVSRRARVEWSEACTGGTAQPCHQTQGGSNESVEQTDDTHLRWTAEIGGREKEWDAEITEQQSDQRVAWTSTSGARNAGVVTFHRLDDDTTRVALQMEVEPDGIIESAGEALGVLDRRVEGDLERFKEFIEQRGAPTGTWRGEVTTRS